MRLLTLSSLVMAMISQALAVQQIDALDVLEAALASETKTVATPTCTCTVRSFGDCPTGCTVSTIPPAFRVAYSCMPSSSMIPTSTSSSDSTTVSTTTTSLNPTTITSLSASESTLSTSTSDALITTTMSLSSLSLATTFTSSLASSTPTSPTNGTVEHHDFVHSRAGVGALAAIGVLSFGAIIGLVFWFLFRRSGKQSSNIGEEAPYEMHRPYLRGGGGRSSLSVTSSTRSLRPYRSRQTLYSGDHWSWNQEQNQAGREQNQEYWPGDPEQDRVTEWRRK